MNDTGWQKWHAMGCGRNLLRREAHAGAAVVGAMACREGRGERRRRLLGEWRNLLPVPLLPSRNDTAH